MTMEQKLSYIERLIANTVRKSKLDLGDMYLLAVQFADNLDTPGINNGFDRKAFLQACSPIGTDFSKEVVHAK